MGEKSEGLYALVTSIDNEGRTDAGAWAASGELR